jgi:hypothetical protein
VAEIGLLVGEVIVITILAKEKICTTKRLAETTGLSVRYIRNILVSLRKRGLVKSMNLQLCSFLGLPIPNPTPSIKEKIHLLNKPLEEIWEDPEFQQKANEIFNTSDLNEFKQKLKSLMKRCLTEKS